MRVVMAETDPAGTRRMAGELGERISPHLADLLRTSWTAEDFTNAIVGPKALVNRMWRFMQRYDLLLTPTLAVAPFPILMQGPDKIAGRLARAWSVVDSLYLSDQPDRAAGGDCAGRVYRRWPAGRDADRRTPSGRSDGFAGERSLRGGSSLARPLAADPEGAGTLGRYFFSGGKKSRARTSILSRGGASGGLVGSRNEVWPVKRARPSVIES